MFTDFLPALAVVVKSKSLLVLQYAILHRNLFTGQNLKNCLVLKPLKDLFLRLFTVVSYSLAVAFIIELI
ncbi:MAG: hypothetical protein BWY04_01486 [candidate division CPR1 bacterium ADurb.Bin160]|jgi:hypothetical protein|uniref:Uncharacterized protein n=1 Tax=candidate division CPR1 bacterium ADurb.Bin160 TaxID=1852826 RepID=A0A1V5ZI87_9BACT|nr:MAG: hypothetical protein BWY04_01486 [candidate division CPR1 bacterium ADurb.Bin160]